MSLFLWTSIKLGLTDHEEEEEDTKDIKVKSPQWRKEEGHETTNLLIAYLQQDHKEHVSNVVKWDISLGTAQKSIGRPT